MFVMFLVVTVVGATTLVKNKDTDTESSVYQSIVDMGYKGSQEQWLASLVGEERGGLNVESSYELAVINGYMGSEQDWLSTIVKTPVNKKDISPYDLICENGYPGSLTEWLNDIADHPDSLGKSIEGERKTEYELACEYGYSGSFTEWLVSVANEKIYN